MMPPEDRLMRDKGVMEANAERFLHVIPFPPFVDPTALDGGGAATPRPAHAVAMPGQGPPVGPAVGPGVLVPAGLGPAPAIIRLAAPVATAVPTGVSSGFSPVSGVWITDEPVPGHAIWEEFGMPFVIATIAGTDRALAMYQGDPITFRLLPAGVQISEYIEALKNVLGIDHRSLGCPDHDDSKSVAQLLRIMTVQAGGLTSGLLGTPVGVSWRDQVALADTSF